MMSMDAQDYLLHREPMLLLDRLLLCEATQVVSEVELGEKHRLFLDENQQIPVWLSLELMAQTVGMWAGYQAKLHNRAPSLGFLLGGRQCKHSVSHYSFGEKLRIEAELLMQDERMASFDARICAADGKLLASGRLTTYQPSEQELATLLAQKK